MAYETYFARGIIEGFDLLRHHEACQVELGRDGEVERKVSVCIGDGANDGEPSVLIEEVVAYN